MITTNIDPNEQAKFDALAADWWDPNGRLHTLHDINPARIAYIERHLSLADSKILDVGCGGGLLTEAMALRDGIVTGLETSASSLKVAKAHAAESKLNIVYSGQTVEQFAAASAPDFDMVTCMEMLEHVPDPASIIKACASLLKPSGWLFLSTINRNLQAYIHTKIAAEYLLKLIPVGTHEYAKYIRPAELVGWCREAELTVQDISGLIYLPIVRRCFVGGKPKVNYLLCARTTDT